VAGRLWSGTGEREEDDPDLIRTYLSSSRSSASRSCRRCADREMACRRLSDGASAADGWSAWLTARGAAAAAANAAASPLSAALDRPVIPVGS